MTPHADSIAWGRVADAAMNALAQLWESMSAESRADLAEVRDGARGAAGDDAQHHPLVVLQGQSMSADDAAWASIADATERALKLPGLSQATKDRLGRHRAACLRAVGVLQCAGDLAAGGRGSKVGGRRLRAVGGRTPQTGGDR